MLRLCRFAYVVTLLFSLPTLWAQSKPNTLNLTFTTIDVPGAQFTNIYGINSAGEMVGGYALPDGTGGAFLYSGGNFTLFNYPGADSTTAFGINDSGVISGTAYIKNHTAAVSFLYDLVSFTTIRAPGDSATLARGINNAGIVVGGDGVTLEGTKGFALVGGRFRTVAPPGSYVYIFADAINNLNQVVGTAEDSGFFYGSGKYSSIAFPGSPQTQPFGINDRGVVVGWYSSQYFSGFALKNGKYLAINYPGAIYTFATGIDNAGQIVGSYSIDTQSYHGFITSPITAEGIEEYGVCADPSACP